MGIAVLAVITGYIFISTVVASIIVLIVNKISPKRTMASSFIAIFLLGFPFWMPLTTFSIFKLSCKFGETGGIVDRPYQLNNFTIDRVRSGYPYNNFWKWGNENESLSNCHEYCSKVLNNVFRENASPWSFIRNGNVEIGVSWEVKNKKNRYMNGRFWVDQITSPNCLAPLEVEEGITSDSQCIAGKEVKLPATVHTVIMDYTYRRGGSLVGKITTYEHQLKSKGELIARYKWYAWDYLLFHEVCPNELKTNHLNGRTWKTKISKDYLFFRHIYDSQETLAIKKQDK